jgi:hypothetical protein
MLAGGARVRRLWWIAGFCGCSADLAPREEGSAPMWAPPPLEAGVVAVVEAASPTLLGDHHVLVGDADGDGWPELAVSRGVDARGLYLVPGARLRGRVDVADAARPVLSDATTPVTHLSAVGDLNRDRLAELWVGREDEAELLLGGASGPATPPSASVIVGETRHVGYGRPTADGPGALIVSAGDGARVFHDGSLRGVLGLDAADATLSHPSCAVARSETGDLDGDGVVEVLVGTTTCDDGAQLLGMERFPEGTRSMRDDVGERFRFSTFREVESQGLAGDADGDGHLDLHVVEGQEVHLLPGPLVGNRDLSDPALTVFANGLRPPVVLALDDVDADGADDVAILDSVGVVSIVLGGRTGALFSGQQDARFRSAFARTLAGGVDLDGDGLAELVVGAARSSVQPWSDELYLLSPAGLLAR